MNENTFFCQCGSIATLDEIVYHNLENELGEPYAEFSFFCSECNRLEESSCSGHIEDREDAYQRMYDYLKTE